MDINKEISLRVRDKREKTEYTQQDMADMLGMSRANYVNLESGRQKWSADKLYTIGCILHCTAWVFYPPVQGVTISKKIKKEVIKRIRTTYNPIKLKNI